MKIITYVMNVKLAITCGVMFVLGGFQVGECSTWLPTSGTSSWFTASNWAPDWDLGGVPASGIDAIINNLGVCSIDGDAICEDFWLGYTRSDSSPVRARVETDASLYIENRLLLGYSSSSYGILEVLGDVDVMGAITIGKVKGDLVIEGGSFLQDSTSQITTVGEIGDGSLTVNDGTFQTKSYISLGGDAASSAGRIEVNGGQLIVTNWTTAGYGGRLVLRADNGLGGTYVQNGGITTVGGLTSVATVPSSIILSNGVFRCISSDWLHRSTIDGENNILIVDGGEFIASNGVSDGVIELTNGGQLELRDGSFITAGNSMLLLESGGVLRVIGSLCDINIGFLRSDGVDDESAIHELILTHDAGHISCIRCTSQAPGGGTARRRTALAGTLRVGLDGGALMLSTNVFPYIRTVTDFESRTYSLDLWDVTQTVNPPPEGTGIQKEITLKASQGSVTLPNDSITFADTAFGHVEVSNIKSGTLPNLTVTLGITEAAKTTAEIALDLRSAGYINAEAADENFVVIDIPSDELVLDSGYFAWDFRDFDGTVNATVHSVDFKFAPMGTVMLVR